MSEAVADGEPMTYSDLNHELHARIREFSGQAVAVELLERLNAQLVRHRFQLALRPGRPRQERAAATLGAEVRFYDAGDHPLVATAELTDRLVDVYRATQPDVVLTRPTEDPYNGDHPAANRMALEAHVLTQAIGYPGPGEAGRPERPPPCRAVPAQDSGEARGAAGYPMDTPAAAPEGWRMHAASGRPVAETALRPHRAARRPPA